MDHVDVGGRRIAFRRAGTGPPVLLVHGAMADSRDWHHQLEAFAPTFTTIAWDAPGCGGSADLPAGHDLDQLVEDLDGFRRALRITGAHVIGHSLGSILSIAFQARHPDAVRSLVLASAYAGWAGSLPPSEVDRRVTLALADLDRPAADAARDMVATLLPADAPAALVDEQVAMVSQARPATTRAMVERFARVDLRPALPGITAPTLLLYGRDDVRAPPWVADALHAAIPGSRLVLLPGVGHSGHVQAPDQWNRVVLEFLDGQS
ncbi:alpha/beta fold hydrolase [Nakamurella multipartita]|uniref:Alpha/beta hydrolase fold protein n=1 Tax=Nakamurella multipartita (strain ATCC 700099 / DSM 44233 / CIP 104796 / JCM 9543 / NBRC 105858 / Y-104) TaxID=479431 RepID=C8X7M5_NAKMY|nr:alpha/beta hydrolase [Nakamurella multipartita]ACV78978.1 alpha/beta hydrolase fold protein [Nakamurella multipartita DSM 44233]